MIAKLTSFLLFTSLAVGLNAQQVSSNRTTSAPFDYGYGPSDTATVAVGSQTWLAKNLNVDHFANGDPIPEAKTAEEWLRVSPAWCYYNNDPANSGKYGKLYNWYAVKDKRGLAPRGWHVPSDIEWSSLTSYLGGENTAGASLKSTFGWEQNGNGNNSSGIAGLPGGNRDGDGVFGDIGDVGYWWSSSEYKSPRVWTRYLVSTFGGVARDSYNKGCGLSVRCVKNH